MIDSSETVLPGGGPDAARRGGRADSRLDRVLRSVREVLRRNWVLALLLAAGMMLRALAQVGYQPALLFIDSKKYIFGTDLTPAARGSFDPIGYTILVLRPVLLVANLGFAALLQHVLGLAMAVGLYVLMVRRGVSRWLAALAVAPVLLDAYQLNAEQTIMPDVLFEALVVAAIVVLLWQPRPGLGLVAAGGLLLGASAPVRQVGEALILPALMFVLAAAWGWRARLLHGTVLVVCFALPVVGYMAYSAMVLKHGFELSNMDDAYLYGRTAHAADCTTLKIPAEVRPLCPSPAAATSLGVDGLVNSELAPRMLYAPVNAKLRRPVDTLPMQRQLAYAVIRQQPLRVIGDIARDSVKVFAITRDGDHGDPSIARWQFQAGYPYYPRSITEDGPNSASGVFAATGGGGDARVFRPAAIALRDYQLHGGYTPGPVLLLALLSGVAGICAARRRDPGHPGLACLLVTGLGLAAMLGADLYEFSWRYQLPALVTLPIAGAFGATVIVRRVRERRAAATAPRGCPGELAIAGSEQVP